MWKAKAPRLSAVFTSLTLATVVVTGCVAISGIDDFRVKVTSEGGIAPGARNFGDLRMNLVEMSPHEGHLFEYRIVNNAGNTVIFRGIVDGISSGNTDLYAPFSVPRQGGALRLDFFNDVDFSGRGDVTKAYNGIAGSPARDGGGSTRDSDHAWRRDPLESSPDFEPVADLTQIRFVHDTNFTDINAYPSGTINPAQDSGYGVQVRLENNTFTGAVTNVNVFKQASGQLTCQYRFRFSETPTLIANVPGCVEPVSQYRIEVFVDQNKNNTYDEPSKEGGDLGYVAIVESGRDRLEAAFDLSKAAEGKNPVSHPW